jgi:hypothetical protein
MSFTTEGKLFLTITITLCTIILPLFIYLFSNRDGCFVNNIMGGVIISIFVSFIIGIGLYLGGILSFTNSQCTNTGLSITPNYYTTSSSNIADPDNN